MTNKESRAYDLGFEYGVDAERKRLRELLANWRLDELDIERGYNAALDDVLKAITPKASLPVLTPN